MNRKKLHPKADRIQGRPMGKPKCKRIRRFVKQSLRRGDD